MSRVFMDNDLVSWEAFVSTGPHGLPDRPSVVFNCLSDPSRPARHVVGEEKADSERFLNKLTEDELRGWLKESDEVD